MEIIPELFANPVEPGSGTNTYTYGHGRLWIDMFVTDSGQCYAEITDLRTEEKRVTAAFSTGAELMGLITQHCTADYYNNYK